MLVVPLQAVPNQAVTVTLGGQYCQFNIYQKFYGLFMDVFVNDALIIGGVICENLNRIVRSTYLGFLGDVAFYDTQGTSDPDYSGLSCRFILIYLTQEENDVLSPPEGLSPFAIPPAPTPSGSSDSDYWTATGVTL